jgi:hypothetical protein
MRKFLFLTSALLLLAVGAVAISCSDDDDDGGSATTAPTSGDSGGGDSQFCADLDELDAALANLDATIGSGAGPDEIEQAADEVEAAYRAVEASGDENIDELEASFNEMNTGVRDEEAVAAAALIDDVDASIDSVRADANC